MKTADEIREYRNYLKYIVAGSPGGPKLSESDRERAKNHLAAICWVLEDWSNPEAVVTRSIVDQVRAKLRGTPHESMFLPE